jgi:hypothetical protein
MPITIPVDEKGTATLEEVIDYLFAEHIDTTDQAGFLTAAPMLKRLANNRGFLGEAICKELKNYKTLQSDSNYSAQVFMLYAPQRMDQNFFMRACFWPAEADQVVKTSGTDPFFYYKPHDHNFNFLTVGYSGPGYWSDYYEYDYEDCVGFKGESVPLRFTEKTRLDEGKVMLYRAFTDIHNQLPADDFSISLNIMENAMRTTVMDQYAFDVKNNVVRDVINRNSSAALFTVLASIGDEEHMDLLNTIATSHPLDRVRLNALNAMASTRSSASEALAVWGLVKESDSRFIREWRRIRTADIEGLAGSAYAAP